MTDDPKNLLANEDQNPILREGYRKSKMTCFAEGASTTFTMSSLEDGDSNQDEDYHEDKSLNAPSESAETFSGSDPSTFQRDELAEIQKAARDDTAKVNFWRQVTAIILLQTALTVTLITSQFLKEQEFASFEDSFNQFSRILGDGAIEHQIALKNGLNTIATEISLYADTNNVTWPFVTVPKFEHYGFNMRTQAGAEYVTFSPFVTEEKREAYIDYSNGQVQEWVEEGHVIQMGSLEGLTDQNATTYHPFIFKKENETIVEDSGHDFYGPLWQCSPPPATYAEINMNALSFPIFNDTVSAAHSLGYEMVSTPTKTSASISLMITDEELADHQDQDIEESGDKRTMLVQPIRRTMSDMNSELVGFVALVTSWDVALAGLLPPDVDGVHVVIENNCEQQFTYEISGGDVIYMGVGDLHQVEYSRYRVGVDLSLHSHPNFTTTKGHCYYSMAIYPSSEFRSLYENNTPLIFSIVVVSTFLLILCVFLIYDKFVSARNNNLMEMAAKTSAIVSDLFPSHLRSRLKETQAVQSQNMSVRGSLKSFLASGPNGQHCGGSKPLADLFLETTVIFADIVGFTSWSSVREPSQVFTLLETIYQAFDQTAKLHRVFKVETVGDCYVAVTGLPEPRKDHAVLMARFARGILKKMHFHTRILEKILGPDTADLSLRVGMHSGPVTAGVLRGERSRFQLFGDTMNMTARMESSSMPGRIHCSKETADLLMKASKGPWLEKRKDQVSLKGYEKKLETYWLLPGRERTESLRSDTNSSVTAASTGVGSSSIEIRLGYEPELLALDERTKRLVSWNVETLQGMMRQIVAHRSSTQNAFSEESGENSDDDNLSESLRALQDQKPLECVREIIQLPEFDVRSSLKYVDPDQVLIPQEVADQLHHLVTTIASMYNDNPFHNFDHASHVVMAVTKFLGRIVAPSHLEGLDGMEKAAHDHTYGITSDPLTGFACAFSALIHDVDHSGVSNAQLVKEGVLIAQMYEGRSVAEQNSLDLSWNLLMESRYDELRAYLFPTPAELARFRQLLVNAVMSTDIVDKDLKALRNSRWEKAFNRVNAHEEDNRDAVNRKATIVIEHIIQAADISHTMQHWHVYRKWNQNLFEELYVAYMSGRMDKDPSTFWYKGEFGFFDFYIIPLTKKLKECGVFGVSSDECLHNALKNREEWAQKGEEVVAQMSMLCREKYGRKHTITFETSKARNDVDV